MKKALGITISLICFVFAGCCILTNTCSSGGLPTGWIFARTMVGGVYQPWAGATVQASAVPDTPNGYSCTPFTNGCILSIPGTTDPTGHFSIASNAVPGEWQIGIQADSECSSGASDVLTIGVSTENGAQLIPCGNITGGSATASPASCTQVVNNSGGQISTNCPATVTLTLNTPGLPTSQALNVSDYNDAGTQEYSYAGNASSTTTITVPVPKVAGDSVLVIYNPQTEEVIGAALFTLNVTIYNPCGNERSCG